MAMTKRRISVALCAVLLCGMLLCSGTPAGAETYPPLPEALSALESDARVTVLTGRLPGALFNPEYYVFKPAGSEPDTGLLFYPGGLVDPRAYAPPARAIAEAGYLVVIASMPFDLAPFGWRRGNSILRRYSSVTTWAVGGHSVGGTYACAFAKRFTGKVDGVVIWASYPSEMFRIDETDLAVTLIYGTNNPNCNDDEIEANRPYLPDDTVYVRIEGANHTQFGYYDTSPEPYQPNDAAADISREEQQRRIIEATVALLDRL
jgi:hypothetical protein